MVAKTVKVKAPLQKFTNQSAEMSDPSQSDKVEIVQLPPTFLSRICA